MEARPPTKKQLYDHSPPISKTIQIRETKLAGYCYGSKDKLICDVPYEPLRMDMPVLADQQELTYNRSVQTQDVVWKTCRKRWMTGTVKRES